MYPTIARNLRQQGWDIEVLYDPMEYLQEKEAKAREMQELTYRQRREAEEARKKQERADLKAEILAELKEAGLLKQDTKKQEPKTGGSKGK